MCVQRVVPVLVIFFLILLIIGCGVYSRAAFISNFASNCGIYSRAVFNRVNTVFNTILILFCSNTHHFAFVTLQYVQQGLSAKINQPNTE